MKKLIVHGRYHGSVRLGRLVDGLHVLVSTAICGEWFDEIEVRLNETIDHEQLLNWIPERGLTRLRPGGRLVLQT